MALIAVTRLPNAGWAQLIPESNTKTLSPKPVQPSCHNAGAPMAEVLDANCSLSSLTRSTSAMSGWLSNWDSIDEGISALSKFTRSYSYRTLAPYSVSHSRTLFCCPPITCFTSRAMACRLSATNASNCTSRAFRRCGSLPDSTASISLSAESRRSWYCRFTFAITSGPAACVSARKTWIRWFSLAASKTAFEILGRCSSASILLVACGVMGCSVELVESWPNKLTKPKTETWAISKTIGRIRGLSAYPDQTLDSSKHKTGLSSLDFPHLNPHWPPICLPRRQAPCNRFSDVFQPLCFRLSL